MEEAQLETLYKYDLRYSFVFTVSQYISENITNSCSGPTFDQPSQFKMNIYLLAQLVTSSPFSAKSSTPEL